MDRDQINNPFDAYVFRANTENTAMAVDIHNMAAKMQTMHDQGLITPEYIDPLFEVNKHLREAQKILNAMPGVPSKPAKPRYKEM